MSSPSNNHSSEPKPPPALSRQDGTGAAAIAPSPVTAEQSEGKKDSTAKDNANVHNNGGGDVQAEEDETTVMPYVKRNTPQPETESKDSLAQTPTNSSNGNSNDMRAVASAFAAASGGTADTTADEGEERKRQSSACASDGTSSPQKNDDEKTAAPSPVSQPQQQQPAAPPGPLIPDVIAFHKSPDGDDFGFRAVLEAITNPQMYSWFRFALRLVAFVSFPMFTIGVHPNTMTKLSFPQMIIASVISTSTCRPTLGEHLGLHTWTWRGITFMLVLGTVYDTWNIAHHVNAWWGLVAFSIFLAALCTHGSIRRFLFLYIFVYMMELRMYTQYFGAVPINNAAWLAADMYMGTFFGVAALCFPYPILTGSFVDTIMSKTFEGLGKMLMGMQSFLVSPMVHASVAFYGDSSPFQKIEYVLSVMPPLLWFTNWEPWEFPTRNPVRRLKLSLFRRVMALTYAAFSIGREVVALRRDLADRTEMQRIRIEVWLQAHQGDSEGEDDTGKELSPEERARIQQNIAKDAETSRNKFFTTMKETYGEERATEVGDKLKALRANTNEHYKAFTATLMQTLTLIGKTKNTPEHLVKKVPFKALAEKEIAFHRNRRVEVLQMLSVQTRLVVDRRERRNAQRKKHSQQRGSINSGNCSFALGNMSMTTAKYAMVKEDAMQILEYQDIIDDIDVYLGFQEMFFAMLMSMISGELVAFGEMMAEYKPDKPLYQRLFAHFITEPWHDFWSSLWSLVHLDTPSDVRTVKDAIKMTSAFLSACAFNLEIWIPEGGTYYFGTTILLGLPMEEESIGMGVCRMAGNSLGCALGYLAYHNTKNLSEMIGLIMSLSFVCHLARNHPVFGQCFFYAGIISMAGMATSISTLELLVRVLASTYTIMAYALCCLFIFPTNTIKIHWGYRMKLSKTMSEAIDDVAISARLPLLDGTQLSNNSCLDSNHNPYGLGSRMSNDSNGDRGEDDDGLLAMTMRSVGRNDNAVDQTLAGLNVQLSIVDKLQAMCTKWMPFAESYPLLRGMQPYPKIPAMQLHGAQLKMIASLRLLVFGIQLIHRPRSEPAHPALKRLFSTSVAEFLNDFSDAVRLIFQNFIDSLQTSRTWSYPVSLMYHGVLMKLRVRLRAILFESFVLIGIPAGRGTLDLDNNDLRDLEHDTSAHMAADEHGRPHETTIIHVDDAGTPQAGGEAVSLSGSFANASFVDRYLLARRAIGEYQQQQNADNPLENEGDQPTPRTFEELKHSVVLNQTMHNMSASFAAGEGGNRSTYMHRARIVEAEARPNDMFPFQQEDTRRLSGSRHHAKGENSDKSSSAFNSRRHSSVPPSRQPSHLVPRSRPHSRPPSALPSPQSNTNNDDVAPHQQRRVVDDRTHQPDYHAESEEFVPVNPKKTPSRLAMAVSRLVQPHESPDRADAVPRYDGPGFSYREDQLDLPVDTDILALVAILSSCGTFMDEVQSISGPVNSISAYQKQLHESSLCLGLLDKLSNCTKKWRSDNYDRYHEPPPPPQKRTQMNAQADVWREWRF